METGRLQLDEHARFEAFFPGSADDFLRLLGAWSIPFALLDDRGAILFWNRGAARFYGRSEDEVLGQAFAETVAEIVRVTQAPVPGVRTQRYEASHRRASGEELAVIVTRTELSAPDGAEGAFVLVTDLTASKKLERGLARRVAQLSVIREIGECLQSAMSLEQILRTILVGATASQGLRFNRAFLLLVDERRGELRGREAIGPADASEAQRIWSRLAASSHTLRELVDQFDDEVDRVPSRALAIARQLVAKLDDDRMFVIQALRRRATTRVEEGRAIGLDDAVPGRVVEILGIDTFVAVPLTAEGRPVGLLLADNAITGRTITDEDIAILELLGLQAAHAIERARLTDELERQVASLAAATQELRENQERMLRNERLSTIGEMAAHVAHEIRNPLVAIGGFARSLLERVPQDQATHDALAIIVDEVRRLESIVRDVLDFSRPASPKIGPVDMRRLFLEAFELLHGEMDQAGIQASVESGEVPDARVDRDQIFQAIVNLLRNAIAAMPRGGAVRVRFRRFPHGVEVAIADTGTGMSQEVLAHALEPFYTTKHDGSGLGLTIASRIVRDHHGEIRIESTEGEGTTIRLRLPAVPEDDDD